MQIGKMLFVMMVKYQMNPTVSFRLAAIVTLLLVRPTYSDIGVPGHSGPGHSDTFPNSVVAGHSGPWTQRYLDAKGTWTQRSASVYQCLTSVTPLAHEGVGL